MDARKKLLSFVRMFLLGGGFALTCIGASLVSLQNEYLHDLMSLPIYAMIVFGFLAMLTGLFWSLCHSMRSKVYQRRGRERHVQIFTIERPSYYPPSYEESRRHVCPDPRPDGGVSGVSAGEGLMGLAPPLYSRDSSEAPDCTWSWEHPPQYSQVEETPERQADAGELRGVLPSK
uniref:Transmembrane protein 252 n=2 Tax=Kryptolebias marmoratus TaxID=37003 RepID=A0A3Q3ASN2_KRYMA